MNQLHHRGEGAVNQEQGYRLLEFEPHVVERKHQTHCMDVYMRKIHSKERKAGVEENYFSVDGPCHQITILSH